MFPRRSKLIALVLAVVAALAFVGSAEAGWVTIKNDTAKAIVVQEVVVVNGKAVRGKPVKLNAGESFREFQNTPGVKNYEIYDAAAPNAPPVWSNQLNCKADKQTFSVAVQKNGRVGVTQVADGK
ncbi:MAG: hypothetical protein J0I06_01315 [Planctomycetes bacterium]|nr:hypothetical protein [Planctomycetota bacterium]